MRRYTCSIDIEHDAGVRTRARALARTRRTSGARTARHQHAQERGAGLEHADAVARDGGGEAIRRRDGPRILCMCDECIV